MNTGDDISGLEIDYHFPTFHDLYVRALSFSVSLSVWNLCILSNYIGKLTLLIVGKKQDILAFSTQEIIDLIMQVFHHFSEKLCIEVGKCILKK